MYGWIVETAEWSLGWVTECAAGCVTEWVRVMLGPPETPGTPDDVFEVNSLGVVPALAPVWVWLGWSATAVPE